MRMWHRRPLTLVQTAGSEVRLKTAAQISEGGDGRLTGGRAHYVARLALDWLEMAWLVFLLPLLLTSARYWLKYSDEKLCELRKAFPFLLFQGLLCPWRGTYRLQGGGWCWCESSQDDQCSHPSECCSLILHWARIWWVQHHGKRGQTA